MRHPKPVLERVAKRPPEIINSWIVFLRRALKLRRLSQYLSEDRIVETAALIALFGPPADPKALEVFQAFVQLFFHYQRIKQWEFGLEKIPADKDSVWRLTRSIQVANILLEPIEKSSFPLASFIRTALELPDPKGYVEVCVRDAPREYRKIRSVFHPNKLTYISERYRGVSGKLADTEYRSTAVSTIKTIS